MFGGLALNLENSADDLGGQWSVLEGDEYKTSRADSEAKFFHYHPTHLLLTAIQWDHADVYPTEESYLNAFKKLIEGLPQNGLLVLSEKILNIKTLDIQYPTITYGQSPNCDYQYSDIQTDTSGLTFKIKHQSTIYVLLSEMLGHYNADNICAAFAMANSIGIDADTIIKSISKFKGLKRRLERRGQTNNGAAVFDDIAHSPIKAKSTLETLRSIYKNKLTVVFEPNTGNRQPQTAPFYNKAFNDADEIIIPRLTKIKSTADSQHLDGSELTKVIQKYHNNVQYIDNDETLIRYLQSNFTDGDCIAFLGSHGFRGMIEILIN